MYYVINFVYYSVIVVLVLAFIYVLYLGFDSKKSDYIFESIDDFFCKTYGFNHISNGTIVQKALHLYYRYYYNPLKRKDKKTLEKEIYGSKYLVGNYDRIDFNSFRHSYKDYVNIYCLVICEEVFKTDDYYSNFSYKLFHFFKAFSSITKNLLYVSEDYNFASHIKWLMYEVYKLELYQMGKDSFFEYNSRFDFDSEKSLIAPYLHNYWQYNDFFTECLFYFYKNKIFDTRDNVVSIIYNNLLPNINFKGEKASLKFVIETICKKNNITLH